jgi:hypothetical protein
MSDCLVAVKQLGHFQANHGCLTPQLTCFLKAKGTHRVPFRDRVTRNSLKMVRDAYPTRS